MGKEYRQMEKSTVYFTKEITPEALSKLYRAMGRTLKGAHIVFRKMKSACDRQGNLSLAVLFKFRLWKI